MADKKISQLPAATTPLAGTEVLPIVQSGTTDQVSVANITAGRDVSAASLTLTTSPLAIASGGTNQTSYTSPASSIAGLVWFDGTSFQNDTTTSHVGYNASTNVFYANTPTFAGNTTLSTGNLVIGTSGKGIDFSAAKSASSTGNLLSYYEQGTWTPAATFQTPGDFSVTYAVQTGTYTRIGNRVILQGYLVASSWSWTTASGYLKITGIPFAPNSTAGYTNYGSMQYGGTTKVGYTQFCPTADPGVSNGLIVYCSGSGVTPSFVVAADVPTTGGNYPLFKFTLVYQV